MSNRIVLINIFLFLFLLITFAEIPDAEVLKYQTDITYKRGTLSKITSCDVKINNRSGDDYTEVSIPFSKMNRVSKVEACIKDLNGNVIKKLSSSDIKEHSYFPDYSFYADEMVKEFTLKHNLYPYILSYTYQEQTNEFFEIEMWKPIIGWEVPTENASLTIQLPKNYSISHRNLRTSEIKTDTINDNIRFSWQAKYTPIDKPEIFMPDRNEYYPRIEIVPENFNYEKKGSFNDWRTYGNWQYSLIENISDLPVSEQNKIKSLISGVTDKLEQIRIIYHYLQDETRYVNISIKTGGMKPFPASFVSENKYGDCKALSNYMKAMLGSVGIISYYTNIYADDDIIAIDKSFPSPQFNHIILNIPLGKDTIWLDCTSDGPFNYLGTFTQNRDAFVVEKDKSRFERTPALKLNDVLDIREVEFSEKSSNEVLARFENTYHGYNFEYLSSLTKQVNDNRKTQIVHEKYIETGFDPIDFKIIEKPRDSAFIQLKYTATTGRIYNQYGNEKIIRLLPFDIPDFNKPSVRKYPVQIDFPVYKSDTLNYQIPQSYSVTNKPENLSFNSEFGKYTIQYIPGNSKMRVIKSFALYAGSYTLKQYPAFYDFIKKVTELEKNTVIITNKSI